MKDFFAIGMFLITASFAFSCTPSSEAVATIPMVDAHTSKTALDWDGVYAGVLPCADCEGIETFISLSTEGIYELRTRYLGKSDQVFFQLGRFVWERSGNVIQLQDQPGGLQRYHVGENRLFHLDSQGQIIVGNLSDMYVLPKIAAGGETSSHMLFAPKGWRLSAFLGGHADALDPIDASQEVPWIQFVLQNMRAHGFSGCNRFSGGFEISPGARLVFLSLATTKMACPDMRMETAFLDILTATHAYLLDGSELTLIDSAMTPLARFHRVEP